MKRVSAPLFMLDPGWPFLISGLVLCAAGVLIPAQRGLEQLQGQLAVMENAETIAFDRLHAHASLLDDLMEGDPQLVERLAAMQLNMVPAGEVPVMLSTGSAPTVSQWIDQTLERPERPDPERRESLLTRMATGRNRLWLFGAGVFFVFLGLLLGPDFNVRRRRDDQFSDENQSPDDRQTTAAGDVVAPADVEDDDAFDGGIDARVAADGGVFDLPDGEETDAIVDEFDRSTTWQPTCLIGPTDDESMDADPDYLVEDDDEDSPVVPEAGTEPIVVSISASSAAGDGDSRSPDEDGDSDRSGINSPIQGRLFAD